VSEEPAAAAEVSAHTADPTAPAPEATQASDAAQADDPAQPGDPAQPEHAPAEVGDPPVETDDPPVETDDPAAEADDPVKAKDPWANANLPWQGKPRRVDIACWGAITLSGLYYLALLPFRASLVGTHPLVSVLLNGSTEAIVSGAAFASKGHGSLVVLLIFGVIGTMKFDIIYWWAGRLWGERVIQMFSGRGKRSQKFVARVNRSGRWLTWPAVVLSPFLPIPNALVYAAAGWTGMSWVTFLILDAIGSLAWVGMLAGLGWALGQSAIDVAQEISKYGLWVTIAIVVLVVASQIRGQRARS
jgi:membrane protein DedA with SNARE-associated domain